MQLSENQRVRLGEVVNVVQNRLPDRSKWTSDRYIAGEHIESRQIRITKYGSIQDDDAKIGSAFHMQFHAGDVLYVTRRAYLRKAGIVDFDGICSNVTLVLRTKEDKLLQPLLPFILQSELFTDYAIQHSIGSTNPFVKWSDLRNFQLSIPPLKDQKRLSELLWSMEDTIRDAQRAIATVKAYRSRYVLHLFGEVTLEEADRTGAERKTAGWKFVPLSELSERITKGTTPTTYGHKYTTQGVNFIKVESITDSGSFIASEFAHIDDSTHQFLKRSIIQENDVLFSIAGALGRVAVVGKDILPANTNQAVAIIRLKQGGISPEYLRYYLSSDVVSDYIAKYSVKGAQANLSLGMLSKLPICYPSARDQLRICNDLRMLDDSIAKYAAHVEAVRELMKMMIDNIMEGRPPGAD